MFRNLTAALALLAATPAAAERMDIELGAITSAIVPTQVLAGDREFGGNGPFMVVETRLTPANGGTRLMATVTFRAEETGGDGSFTRITTAPIEVWHSQRGERIDYIVGNSVARVQWTSAAGNGPFSNTGILGPSEDGGRIVTRPGAGFINQITYLGDTMGDDISTDQNPHGDTSIRRITFNPITIETVD